jgi:hypothetical protein
MRFRSTSDTTFFEGYGSKLLNSPNWPKIDYGSASIIPYTKEGFILVGEPCNKKLLTKFGGKIENKDGENYFKTALREFREETNVDSNPITENILKGANTTIIHFDQRIDAENGPPKSVVFFVPFQTLENFVFFQNDEMCDVHYLNVFNYRLGTVDPETTHYINFLKNHILISKSSDIINIVFETSDFAVIDLKKKFVAVKKKTFTLNGKDFIANTDNFALVSTQDAGLGIRYLVYVLFEGNDFSLIFSKKKFENLHNVVQSLSDAQEPASEACCNVRREIQKIVEDYCQNKPPSYENLINAAQTISQVVVEIQEIENNSASEAVQPILDSYSDLFQVRYTRKFLANDIEHKITPETNNIIHLSTHELNDKNFAKKLTLHTLHDRRSNEEDFLQIVIGVKNSVDLSKYEFITEIETYEILSNHIAIEFRTQQFDMQTNSSLAKDIIFNVPDIILSEFHCVGIVYVVYDKTSFRTNHYFAHVKTAEKWYICDDSSVEPLNQGMFNSKSPHRPTDSIASLAFYSKCSSNTLNTPLGLPNLKLTCYFNAFLQAMMPIFCGQTVGPSTASSSSSLPGSNFRSENVESLFNKQVVEFPRILKEITNFDGRKRSHWIWYVFPTSKPGDYEPSPPTAVTNEADALELLHALSNTPSFGHLDKSLLDLWIEILDTLQVVFEDDKGRIELCLKQWSPYTTVQEKYSSFYDTFIRRIPVILRQSP